MSYTPLTGQQRQAKEATKHTQAANAQVKTQLPFEDQRCFEDAKRGFIASIDPLIIPRDNGQSAYDLSRFGFLAAEAPDTVNPSLWRQAQLNAQNNGLFEVVDGLYQVRAFDISNMTLIAGDRGWVIVDPLTSTESARAALDLANRELGYRPVTGVVITHSHVDHFAGISGVTSADAVANAEVPVIAPEHFVDEALSENVLAGNVMNRRATYMYGNLLHPGPKSFVTTGLGAALSMGTTSFIVPTDFITQTGETRCIDGIEFEFQMTPGTEAPAEFVFYLPQFKALCMAEITSHHLHNVYTLRGAQVRDALAWSQQINQSIDLFGDRLTIEFASHHWPIWGQNAARTYLEKQRDLYKFIHDQSLRLANQGYTKEEIAERITLPDELGQEFYNRGYYGSVHHNTRAVYVKYLGYFDGNPANLHPLPPAESATRYVAAMGGEDQVVQIAQNSFDKGDYRWVAELLNHIMMINPEHQPARALLADALEQMGYQAESAPWRNFYLCGALELRHGLPAGSDYRATEGIARGMPMANVFQLTSVRLSPSAAAGMNLDINLILSEPEEHWLMRIQNSVFHAFPEQQSTTATVTLRLPGLAFKRMMLGLVTPQALLESNILTLDGDTSKLTEFTDLFESFPRRFPIMTPRPN